MRKATKMVTPDVVFTDRSQSGLNRFEHMCTHWKDKKKWKLPQWLLSHCCLARELPVPTCDLSSGSFWWHWNTGKVSSKSSIALDHPWTEIKYKHLSRSSKTSNWNSKQHNVGKSKQETTQYQQQINVGLKLQPGLKKSQFYSIIIIT